MFAIGWNFPTTRLWNAPANVAIGQGTRNGSGAVEPPDFRPQQLDDNAKTLADNPSPSAPILANVILLPDGQRFVDWLT